MRRILLFSMASVLVLACNNKKSTDNKTPTTETTTTTPTTSGWDQGNRTAFMDRCVNDSKGQMDEAKARDYCSCMLEKIEARYPVADSASALSMKELQDMAKDCIK